MKAQTLLARLAALALAGAPGGCVLAVDGGGHHRDGFGYHSHSVRTRVASADIQGKSGSPLTGRATFTQLDTGVLVDLTIHGATPGWHAVHIHERGDCSAPDASSAGGHFNPDELRHGSPHAPEHHAGDLGNVFVDESGRGHALILMPELTVGPGSHSVVGRAIVVHESADDLVSQPTGAAGGRIGCGTIR